jgi:hypothetical protein
MKINKMFIGIMGIINFFTLIVFPFVVIVLLVPFGVIAFANGIYLCVFLFSICSIFGYSTVGFLFLIHRFLMFLERKGYLKK